METINNKLADARTHAQLLFQASLALIDAKTIKLKSA